MRKSCTPSPASFKIFPLGRASSETWAAIRKVVPASVPVKEGDDSVSFSLNAPEVTKTKLIQVIASGATLEGRTAVEIRPAVDAKFKAVETQLAQLDLPIGWVDDRQATRPVL